MGKLCGLLFLFIFFLSLLSVAPISAHRSGCHRWHSCPTDRGTYTCGDTGYCSRCPDNVYCLNGSPRIGGFSNPTNTPIPIPTRIIIPTSTPTPKPTATPTPTPTVEPTPTQEPQVMGETESQGSTGDTILGLAILGGMGFGTFWLVRKIWDRFRKPSEGENT